ncbi:MAG: hypothetical protein WB679_01820 [Terracidiphilus sp.]
MRIPAAAIPQRLVFRTNGFIRLGRIDCGFDQTVAGAKRAAQQVENSMIV